MDSLWPPSVSYANIIFSSCVFFLLMAALCNRAGHYIFVLWFLIFSYLLSSFFSSPILRCRKLNVYHTWCGPSANLGCRSKTWCTRLAGKKQDVMSPRNRHLHAHHHTSLSGSIFATTACIDSRKNLLNINISSTCPHNTVISGLLAAEIGSTIWGTPANFSGFRAFVALLHGI